MNFSYNSILAISLFLIGAFKVVNVKGIIGGIRVGAGYLQHQVSIQVNNHHVCSGAILNSNNILAVASCFMNHQGFFNRRYRIFAGVGSFGPEPSSSGTRFVTEVSKITVHARHLASNNSAWNLAVVQTTYRLPLDRYSSIYNVELPDARHGRSSNYMTTGQKYVGGYGVAHTTANDYGGNPETICVNRCTDLKCSEVEVLRDHHCRNYLPAENSDNLFCAQMLPRNNIRKGNCYGDLGNPVVMNKEVIGMLVYHRLDCDESHHPAIYIKVSMFTEFINYAIRSPDQLDRNLVTVATYNRNGVLVVM